MKMSQKTREELLPCLRQRYASRNREGKGRMLDEFCEQWQCDRKHAIKLFSGKVGWGGQVGVKRGAPTLYGPDVVKVLDAIWRVGEQACGKRLKSMLPLWLAQNCFTPESITQACEDSLLSLIEAIEDLSRHLKNIEQTTEKILTEEANLADRHTVELIRSIPGFGAKTAPVLAAFLPTGFEQWGSKKQIVAKLQAYFGFDPRRRESGTFKGKVKISKRGIGIVRTTLFQASFCSMSHDPKLRQYYDKKKAEGDHHTKAVIDLMRKNLKRVVAVLINQKEFQHLDEKTA